MTVGHLHEQLRVLADLLVQLRQLVACHWPTGLLLRCQLVVLAAQPRLSHLLHSQHINISISRQHRVQHESRQPDTCCHDLCRHVEACDTCNVWWPSEIQRRWLLACSCSAASSCVAAASISSRSTMKSLSSSSSSGSGPSSGEGASTDCVRESGARRALQAAVV